VKKSVQHPHREKKIRFRNAKKYLRLRASDTFSAARFSAASSCWMPWVWLAILIQKPPDLITVLLELAENSTGTRQGKTGAPDDSHMTAPSSIITPTPVEFWTIRPIRTMWSFKVGIADNWQCWHIDYYAKTK